MTQTTSGPTRRAAHRIPKMSEVIAAELRGRILQRELLPGDSLLPEALLMDRYQVSRPTLREALRLLEAENLISVRRGSHRGPVVSLPDASVAAASVAIQLQLRASTLADVYTFRQIFEPRAVRLAADRATPDDVARLRELLTEAAGNLQDAQAFAESSWRFHQALVELAAIETMSVLADTLRHISEQHAATSLRRAPDAVEQQERALLAQHRVVDLIEAGAGEAAEAFWARHMDVAWSVMAADLRQISITELLD